MTRWGQGSLPSRSPQGPGTLGSSPICPLPSALWGSWARAVGGGHSTATLSVGPGDMPCLPYCFCQPTWTEINVTGAKGHLWWSWAKGQGSLEAPELRVVPCLVPGGQEARVGHREGQQEKAPLHHLVLSAGRSPPPPTATQMAKRQGDRWRWLAGLRVYFVRRHSQAKEHTHAHLSVSTHEVPHRGLCDS